MQRLIANRYEMESLVGRGGMGSVYRARDRVLMREVAVKHLAAQSVGSEQETRLRAEGMMLAKVSHANVLRIYDVVQDEGGTWLISEWIDGQPLTILDGRPVHPYVIGSLAVQILDALAASHRVAVVHRDLKPSNIMVGADGKLRLIDFGIAFHPGISTGQTIAGSFRYTDPRILEGDRPDEGSDLYACGLLIVEWMTGRAFWPELAPLALFRLARNDLANRLDELSAGEHPLLAALARTLLIEKRVNANRPGAPTGGAATAAAKVRVWLTECGIGDPAEVVAAWLNSEPSGTFLRAHGDGAEIVRTLGRSDLTSKERAAWMAFAQQRTPDARKIPRRSRSRVPAKACIGTAAALVLFAGLALLYRARTLPTRQPPSPQADVAVTAAHSAASTRAEELNEVAPDAHQASGKQDEDKKRSSSSPPPPSASPAKLARRTSVVHILADAWADVEVDGIAVGRVPRADGFVLNEGRHRLVLTSPFVEPLETIIHVTAGQVSEWRYSLRRKTRRIALALRRPADIFVAGRWHVGQSEVTVNLPFGEHEVRLRRDGIDHGSRSIAVHPNSPDTYHIED